MKWPGAAGIPVSSPVKLDEPGKIARQGVVRLVGFTVADPVMTKVPPLPVHDVISRLS